MRVYCARDVRNVIYVFIVRDFHSIFLAGLPAHGQFNRAGGVKIISPLPYRHSGVIAEDPMPKPSFGPTSFGPTWPHPTSHTEFHNLRFRGTEASQARCRNPLGITIPAGDRTLKLPQDQIDALASKARMTPQEKAIFGRLASTPNTVVPRETLRAAVPGQAPRTLYTHIKNIRRKLSESGQHNWTIKTEAGVGYSFAAHE